MVMVRAKFKVMSITRTMGSEWDKETNSYKYMEVQTIGLSPVVGDSPENKAFWAATPSGRIELGIVNADVAGGFHLDKEYYIDFTPA